MQYELATLPLLPPMTTFALRTDRVDVVLISDVLDVDEDAKHAVAKDLVAEMDRDGKAEAHRVVGQWPASAP